MVKQTDRRGAYNNKVLFAVAGFAGAMLAFFFLVPTGGKAKTAVNHLAVSQATNPAGVQPVMINACVFDNKGQLTGPFAMAKVVRSEDEWKKLLTAEQYYVTRNSGTERAFCGNLLDNKKEGVYSCVCCQLPLFSSNAKFNSGTGWPSFFQPICKENVTEKSDNAHGMIRTEINCARCDAHLGHVFDDGPRDKTGLRFCLNSESLEFTEEKDLPKLAEKVK